MELTILFAPLIGSLLCGLGWRFIGETAAMWVSTGFLFLAALLSWVVFLTFDGVTEQIQILRWIESGSLSSDWSIRLDRLTSIMLIVITTVSSLVHLYSFGYMANDPQWKDGEIYKPRFFAYLSFFTFAMLMLVTSDNLIQMFFGWEGVGVASYLLIGFYYRKPSANAAAIKAFVVNRIGDFGFALGIFGLYMLTDSVRFDDIFAAMPAVAEMSITFLWADWNAANLLAVLLFIGAMGKSAQLILHTWLPDAMEGPTPVSALIHAATMVTAGVFLMCRMSPLLEFAPQATMFITVLGATTAFFAATVGLVQTDIKRVIAYSTCSQLGYMFVAVGVGMYSAAMFHLFTHAFFKAMLFLGAGSVIHAMHHEQDMNNYGALRKKIPWTFRAMMVGTLAITGVGIPLTHYGFAGFLSKDAIIESAYAGGSSYGFWMLVIAAAMTSFYSWRLMFMTFYGEARGDKHTHDHAHESPMVMLIPLGVLALGAIFAGMIWFKPFFGHVDQVATFYGIPYEEVGAHGADKVEGATDDHGDAAKDGKAEHHYAFAGKPGEGALYIAPDNHILDDAHAVPNWVKVSPFVAMLGGFLMAMWFYIWNPTLPGRLAESQRPLYLFLKNKWYFDELYDYIFIQSSKKIGLFFWKIIDVKIIDKFGPDGLSLLIKNLSLKASKFQSGFIYQYAFMILIGLSALLTFLILQ